MEWNESLGELAISAVLSMRGFAPEEVAEQYYKQWHTHYLTLNNETIPLPKKTLQAFLDLSWIEMWQEMKRVGEALLSNSLLQMKDYVIHGNLVSYILSNIVEHGHFGTIVRLIQRMGMKVAIAFIQHTLSLIPEGNPIRAVLAVLSDAGQATTELSTANPVLVALTTALTVTWIIQAEECIDIPEPVTEVGRRLAGLPDLLRSLYDIISSFAMLPRRSQGTLTQLYADPTDISGYLGGGLCITASQCE